MNTKKQNLSDVSGVFSWKKQRKSLFETLVIIFTALACTLLLNSLRGDNNPHSAVPVIIMFCFAICMLIILAIYTLADHILTPRLLGKHIGEWEQIAKNKAKERLDAEYRLRVVDCPMHQKIFQATIDEDKKFIEIYDASRHVYELQLFTEVMKNKNLVGRLYAGLMPLSYYENRKLALE